MQKKCDTLEMRVLRPAMGRNQIEHRSELAERIGMEYQCLRRRVIVVPGSMRLYELNGIDEELALTPAEIIALVKRKEVKECEEWLRDWSQQHPYVS